MRILEFFAERSAAPGAIDRGRAMRAALSTYSDAEINAIKERLESCRDRFVLRTAADAER